MSDLTVIFALIFLAASLAIYGVYWVLVFNRRSANIVNRRLDLVGKLDSSAAVLETLRRERGFRDDANPLLRQCSDWLTQTGIVVQRSTLVLVFGAICLALMIIFSSALGLGIASLSLSVAVAAAAIVLYLANKRSRRIFTFTDQLPDAIDIIVRGVRVGLPFSTAVALVAREMPDPIGTEFGILADEIGFGLDTQTALHNLHRRVGQEDLTFLIVALNIQQRTGGNVAEILGRLSRLMRKRSAMRMKIRALSAEGRVSAYFLSALPFILILAMSVVSPHYFDPVRSLTILEPAVAVGLTLLIVGNLIMYRMVNFRY
ncbi:MAG TPA: type II secretion system F family protein [Xanthobacteraceae bacterium]|nr:type II secretion system F family protein [Xanthobacteraceae bacterium]